VQPGHLLGCDLEGEQAAVDLDPAVDQRLARLEDEQLLELVPVLRDDGVGTLESGPPDVGG